MKNISILVTLFLFTVTLNAQVPVPAEPQSQPIVLTGGTAHLGTGEIVENAVIVFDEGKITAVGSAGTSYPSGAEVIDIEGQHIYPSFILMNSIVGLSEVSSIRAMNDEEEEGSINPNVRSVISYNTDSENIPTFRFNGILLAESAPEGGIISGTSSVMEMEGWNWEDACHTMDMGMHVHWPSRTRRNFDYSTFTVTEEKNKNYEKYVTDIKGHFADAKAYMDAEDKTTNLKMEAMKGLFTGDMVLFVHARAAKEMIESLTFAQSLGIPKIVLVGGSDAVHISSYLADHEIPIVIPPTHSLPDRTDQAIDLPYSLPNILTEAGVKVVLSHEDMLANARNLPFYAGTAAAYGMDKEEALKLITINAAEALGIEDQVGTIEVGKDATLFVSQGDALDIRGNVLSYAFISGKKVVLPNKQQALYDRYSEKYGHTR